MTFNPDIVREYQDFMQYYGAWGGYRNLSKFNWTPRAVKAQIKRTEWSQREKLVDYLIVWGKELTAKLISTGESSDQANGRAVEKSVREIEDYLHQRARVFA